MPRGHKTHSEARRELLEASKEWKLEMAKPKTVATLAAATVGALDSVVAAQNFLLDREEALEVHVSKNTEGVGIAQKIRPTAKDQGGDGAWGAFSYYTNQKQKGA